MNQIYNLFYCKSGDDRFPYLEYYSCNCILCEEETVIFKMKTSILDATRNKSSDKQYPNPNKPQYKLLPTKHGYWKDLFGLVYNYPVLIDSYKLFSPKICSNCNHKLRMFHQGKL